MQDISRDGDLKRPAYFHPASCAKKQASNDWLVPAEDSMNEQKTRLGRDVYIALAAVGWADGELDQEEADAIVRTALEEGLELEEIQEIEEATKSPVDMGVIDRKSMSKEDRLFVYAVASWISRIDGRVTSEEIDALVKLGEALKVSEGPRRHADDIVEQVANLSDDDRPARYDLPALRRIIGERLRLAKMVRSKGKG